MLSPPVASFAAGLIEIGMPAHHVRQNLILSNMMVTIMAKKSVGKAAARGAKRSAAGLSGSAAARAKAAQGDATTGRPNVSKARFNAVMRAAERSGLLTEKSGRIGGRVSPALVKQAKRQTGIQTDTDLIEFALATVALEDNFAEAFKESRGKVDPKLKLGF
jgi:hypothetical protein